MPTKRINVNGQMVNVKLCPPKSASKVGELTDVMGSNTDWQGGRVPRKEGN